MLNNKKVIRGIALFLAALMALGILAVILNVI